MRQHSRRRFMLITAEVVGAAATGGAFLGGDNRWPVVTRSTKALGSEVSITARHANARAADAAIDAAFAELALVERLMSIYQPESQISLLNRMGRIDHPHPYVTEVLRHAMLVSQQTGGAFDITVQPLWEVFSSAAKEQCIPSGADIAAARAKVNWTNLDLQSDCVRLWRPSTSVTLNGIAKGFATDRVLAMLRDHAIEHALINAGEHAPLGQSAAGDDWTVGIQHPRQADAYVALADLGGRCLATSGDYATAFSSDRRYNHIFDPLTGYSPTELASVSVLAPTAMQADALSTSLFVLGPDKGLELLRRTPNTDAFFVLKDGETIVTLGFPLVEEGRAA